MIRRTFPDGGGAPIPPAYTERPREVSSSKKPVDPNEPDRWFFSLPPPWSLVPRVDEIGNSVHYKSYKDDPVYTDWGRYYQELEGQEWDDGGRLPLPHQWSLFGNDVPGQPGVQDLPADALGLMLRKRAFDGMVSVASVDVSGPCFSRVQVGEKILSINGTPAAKVTHKRAVELSNGPKLQIASHCVLEIQSEDGAVRSEVVQRRQIPLDLPASYPGVPHLNVVPSTRMISTIEHKPPEHQDSSKPSAATPPRPSVGNQDVVRGPVSARDSQDYLQQKLAATHFALPIPYMPPATTPGQPLPQRRQTLRGDPSPPPSPPTVLVGMIPTGGGIPAGPAQQIPPPPGVLHPLSTPDDVMAEMWKAWSGVACAPSGAQPELTDRTTAPGGLQTLGGRTKWSTVPVGKVTITVIQATKMPITDTFFLPRSYVRITSPGNSFHTATVEGIHPRWDEVAVVPITQANLDSEILVHVCSSQLLGADEKRGTIVFRVHDLAKLPPVMGPDQTKRRMTRSEGWWPVTDRPGETNVLYMVLEYEEYEEYEHARRT